jgi:hypothetical protein
VVGFKPRNGGKLVINWLVEQNFCRKDENIPGDWL